MGDIRKDGLAASIINKSSNKYFQIIKQRVNKIIHDRKDSNLFKQPPHALRIRALINAIASYLSLRDFVRFSEVNKLIYVGCHDPIPLKQINLLEIKNYSKLHIGKYSKIRYLLIKAHQFVRECQGSQLRNVTDLHLDGEQQDLQNVGRLYSLLSMLPCATIKRLKLNNFGDFENYQGIKARPLINLLSWFDQLQCLCIGEMCMFGNSSSLPAQTAFLRDLTQQSCLQHITELELLDNIPHFLYICLLKQVVKTLESFTFYDGKDDEWSMPNVQFPKLQRMVIQNATPWNSFKLISKMKHLKHLHLTNIDHVIISSSQQWENQWRDLITYLLNDFTELESVTINCSKPKCLDQLIHWICNATINKKKCATKSIPITIECQETMVDQQLQKRQLIYFADHIKLKTKNDKIRFKCYNLMFEDYNELKFVHNPEPNCIVCKKKEQSSKTLKCAYCNGIYHTQCLNPSQKACWYNNVVWFCRECADCFQHIPLRGKKTKYKLKHYYEPTLRHLPRFLKEYPNWERDPLPNPHSNPALYLHRKKEKIEGIWFYMEF